MTVSINRALDTMTYNYADTLTIYLHDEKNLLDEFLKIPKSRLDLISETVSKARKIRFNKCKLKRGNLSKELPKSLIYEFFEDCPNKYRDAYLFCFFFGLREGELKNINYIEKLDLLQIENFKEDRIEYLPVHGHTKKLMKKIDVVKKINPKNLREWMRRILADKNVCYGKSTDGRCLWLYSVHSFRHTAINLFSEIEPDYMKQICFSRHMPGRLAGSLANYRNVNPQNIRIALENTFKEFYFLI